jgi:hypothetical protein
VLVHLTLVPELGAVLICRLQPRALVRMQFNRRAADVIAGKVSCEMLQNAACSRFLGLVYI